MLTSSFSRPSAHDPDEDVCVVDNRTVVAVLEKEYASATHPMPPRWGHERGQESDQEMGIRWSWREWS